MEKASRVRRHQQRQGIARWRPRLCDDSVVSRRRPAPNIEMNFEGQHHYLNSIQRRVVMSNWPKCTRQQQQQRETRHWLIGSATDCAIKNWKKMARSKTRWLWVTHYWSRSRGYACEILENQIHLAAGSSRPTRTLLHQCPTNTSCDTREQPLLAAVVNVLVATTPSRLRRRRQPASLKCPKWSKSCSERRDYASDNEVVVRRLKRVGRIAPVRKLFYTLARRIYRDKLPLTGFSMHFALSQLLSLFSVEITCIYQLFTTGSLVRFLEVMIPHFPVTDQLCVMPIS